MGKILASLCGFGRRGGTTRDVVCGDVITIGGTNGLARDIISGNHGHGVFITDAGTSGNLVEGDSIGTHALDVANLGNGGDGVQIANGASNNFIGGSDGNGINYIENNDVGIFVAGAGTGNWIRFDVVRFNGFTAPANLSGDGVAIGNTAGTNLMDVTFTSNRDWGLDVINSPSHNAGGLTFANNGHGSIYVVYWARRAPVATAQRLVASRALQRDPKASP